MVALGPSVLVAIESIDRRFSPIRNTFALQRSRVLVPRDGTDAIGLATI
jgi:hypothetical protein